MGNKLSNSVAVHSGDKVPRTPDDPLLLELTFSAKKEFMQSSDNAQCNMFLVVFDGVDRNEIGRTKVSVDTGPTLSWSEKIPVKFRFGAKQPLVFHVYDVNQAFRGSPVEKLQLHDQTLVATSECHLSQVAAAGNKACTFLLQNKQASWQIAKLTVQAEETDASRAVSMIVRYCPAPQEKEMEKAREVRLLKLTKCKGKKPIHTYTERVKSPKPVWIVSCTREEIGSKDDNFVIEGLKVNNNGTFTAFGKLTTSVSNLEKGKKKDKDGLSVDMLERHTFLDYLSSTSKLGCLVGVQISGTEVRPKSLQQSHSSSNLISPEKVMNNVVAALEPYISDRRYPAWGFGKKISIDRETSFCFNLNLKPNKPEVHHVEGLVEAFKRASNNVVLDDGDIPDSLMSEVIKKASDFVSNSHGHDGHTYYVLLIITDGVFFDVPKTICSLVDASKLPMSILIVDVGDSISFKNLKKCCAENGDPLARPEGDINLRDKVLCFSRSELPTDEQHMAETLLNGLPGQFCAHLETEGTKLR